MEENKTVTSFKGFTAEFKCRGMQYEVGATYTHEGKVKACDSGFHACENPLDVWNYYGPAESRFAVVEQSGELSRHGDDSKIASAKITITAELALGEYVKRAVQWVIDRCAQDAGSDERVQSASGYYAQLAASGNSAQLAASGNYAELAASGYSAQLAASGYYAKLAASGNSAQLAASGEDSVIASSSYAATAKGADGTWIALAEFDGNAKCIGFAVGCVGKDGIKADTWYCAKGGKLEEVK